MKKELSENQTTQLLETLKLRFKKNANRHKGIAWEKVEERLAKSKKKLWSLFQMEETGGEPDVVSFEKETGEYIFYDCVAETPKGRRSLCYDNAALNSRKENKPKNSAINMAAEMEIEVLTEEQYLQLQKHGTFDAKTSSWLNTPQEVRKLGGGISGEFRFGRTFIYANGAESYFAARGFRGMLKV